MIKVCKIRIYPNQSQLNLIYRTLGCCRFAQNMYLATNIENHKEGKPFISGYDFSKKLNYLKRSDPNYSWIREYSSKAIKDAIMTGEKSFKKFFRKQGGFPRFKSRKRMNKESFFFIKDGIHYLDKTHLKLPILGTIRITESNYLPPIETVTSGRVIRKFNKFYISLIYETERQKNSKDFSRTWNRCWGKKLL